MTQCCTPLPWRGFCRYSKAPMWTLETIILVSLTFLLGGAVKGVIGVGLPIVAIALLAATLGLKPAMAIMVVPCLITNIWQGLVGGALITIVKRIWALLLASCIGIWLGVHVLAGADARLLTAVLGVVLCAYAAFSLVRPQIPAPEQWEQWLSPAVGATSGFMFGLTGSYMVPGVLYVQALGLPRDLLVQTLGIIFVTISAALGVALTRNALFTTELGLLSTAALLPTALGMLLGQRIRHRLSETLFRRAFFTGLLLVGVYMTVRSLW